MSRVNIVVIHDSATTNIYTLSLHDALPIFPADLDRRLAHAIVDRFSVRRLIVEAPEIEDANVSRVERDRKSTRLNSSHRCISYAVFCLKKKIKLLYNNNN